MCDSWKLPTSDDLTIDDIERIFLQMPRLDVVRLTGGEPFLRPDFPTIVELAQELLQPLAMHITTNGFLTSRIVRMVEERDSRTPLILLISIDGVGDKHNQVRGSTIAWKRVTETLTELAPLQAGRNVRLAVNQTLVDADAAEEYRRLRDFLRPLGIPHQVVFAYETSATYNTTRELNLAPASLGDFPFRAGLKADDLQSLMDELHRDVRRLPWVERLAKRYYLRGIFQRLLHGQADPCPPCVALQAHLRLFPNGDVPTCQFNGQVVGNLKRQSFLEVWNSSATSGAARLGTQMPRMLGGVRSNSQCPVLAGYRPIHLSTHRWSRSRRGDPVGSRLGLMWWRVGGRGDPSARASGYSG
jgi:Fe-coproporphyrin III synthase